MMSSPGLPSSAHIWSAAGLLSVIVLRFVIQGFVAASDADLSVNRGFLFIYFEAA